MAPPQAWAHDVKNGTIRRLGGALAVVASSLAGTSATRVSAFAMRYRLTLFSNFTYFLADQDHGDQFAQQDERSVYGLRAVLGLRADSLRTEVEGLNSSIYSGTANATQWSPKLALVAGPFAKTEFFFNAGRGYHSNDARGTTDPVQRVPPLVASRGYEIGTRTEALPGLQRALAAVDHDEPALGLEVHAEDRDHARRLQPVRPQGQRHPVLLRVAHAAR